MGQGNQVRGHQGRVIPPDCCTAPCFSTPRLQWVNRYTSDLDGMSASTSSGRTPKGEIDVMGHLRTNAPFNLVGVQSPSYLILLGFPLFCVRAV
jgi:hypothetical protein